ncbi:DeoR family transcriptional regulator [Methylobacterium persicinum]
MRGTERRARLLEALELGEIDVDDLARRFGVSASTVRRDLQHLSGTKAVRRTYGGAILAGGRRRPPSTRGWRSTARRSRPSPGPPWPWSRTAKR